MVPSAARTNRPKTNFRSSPQVQHMPSARTRTDVPRSGRRERSSRATILALLSRRYRSCNRRQSCSLARWSGGRLTNGPHSRELVAGRITFDMASPCPLDGGDSSRRGAQFLASTKLHQSNRFRFLLNRSNPRIVELRASKLLVALPHELAPTRCELVDREPLQGLRGRRRSWRGA